MLRTAVASLGGKGLVIQMRQPMETLVALITEK
jgi:hypothetical protein